VVIEIFYDYVTWSKWLVEALANSRHSGMIPYDMTIHDMIYNTYDTVSFENTKNLSSIIYSAAASRRLPERKEATDGTTDGTSRSLALSRRSLSYIIRKKNQNLLLLLFLILPGTE
jgi:hypothetical protein